MCQQDIVNSSEITKLAKAQHIMGLFVGTLPDKTACRIPLSEGNATSV